MANRGWDSSVAGESMASNARGTGRVSGTDGAEQFIRPADCGVPDSAGNTLGSRGDVHDWAGGVQG